MTYDGKHEWVPAPGNNNHRCIKCGRVFHDLHRDLPGCYATASLRADHVVHVRAWWARDAPVRCRVVSLSGTHATVAPQEGNPHHRFVSLDALISSVEAP